MLRCNKSRSRDSAETARDCLRAGLIDDLLMFSRLGRATITARRVSLRRLVDEARAELSPGREGRTIEWQIGPLPEVYGDPVLLKSVVVNLLSNALKYTRHRDTARVEVGCQDKEGEVVCFVRDNGAGFDMRFVEQTVRSVPAIAPVG